jgi:hypothetical protein
LETAPIACSIGHIVMACQESEPDVSNDDCTLEGQDEAEYTVSAKEDNSPSRSISDDIEEPDTLDDMERFEFEMQWTSKRRRRVRESFDGSLALVGRKQKPLSLSRSPSCRSSQVNEFHILDAPFRPALDERSQYLSAGNTTRRSTLPTASVNPNCSGRLPIKIEIRPPTPPSPVCWRESSTRRKPRDLDMRRIDTDYILSRDFVHDVNQMLDKIWGWPAERVKPYRLSLQQDPENSGRQVSILDIGMRFWVVKITNPDKLILRSSLSCDYTFADLPGDCLVNGCDLGCPRPTTWIDQYEKLQDKRRSLNLHQTEILPTLDGSNIRADLPRIFGEQTLPLPTVRWERLGFQSLEERFAAAKLLKSSYANNTSLQSAEKRRQHFKACSPPKRVKQEDILKGQQVSSVTAHGEVSIQASPPNADNKLKSEVTYIERLPDNTDPSPAPMTSSIPLRITSQKSTVESQSSLQVTSDKKEDTV